MILTSIPRQLRIDDAVPLRSPGSVLQDDYMLPKAMTAALLARRTGIPARHLRGIFTGAPLHAEEAFRLAAALRTSPLYWLLLQARYELEQIRREVARGLDEHSA